MNKRQFAYRSLIIISGILILLYCFLSVIQQIQTSSFTIQEVVDWIIVFLLFILCRALPVYIAKDKSIDVSFIPVVASAMVFGPHLTVVLFSFTIIFFFLRDEQTHELHYALAVAPWNELFNLFNIIISVFVGGQFLLIMGGIGPALRIPYSILPATIFAFITIFSNLIFFIWNFVCSGKDHFFPMFFRNIWGILPNVISTIPFGILLGILLNQKNGSYFILLFMFPLLLARYSFKLYLDSKSMYMRTISSLSMAIDAKDQYTQGHSKRVAFLSERLAIAMNLPTEMVENIKVAAILHDIGKIGISNSVLNKPSSLTEEEYEHIKQHPTIGCKIIEDIKLAPTINEAVLYHHRHYDGTGYPPNGPAYGELPIAAAILGVADAYDAMTTDRPYRKGRSKEEATAEIHKYAGTQFKPEVAQVFESLIFSLDLEKEAN